MKTVAHINIKLYQCITEDIVSSKVIITDRQIKHIQERHPGDYEKYFQYVPDILTDPDYILEANKPQTGLLLKEISTDKTPIKLILRLATSTETNLHYQHSIITFMKIDSKEWHRLLRNKNILYKKNEHCYNQNI